MPSYPSPWRWPATCSRPRRVAFTLGVIGAAAEAGGVLGPLYGAVPGPAVRMAERVSGQPPPGAAPGRARLVGAGNRLRRRERSDRRPTHARAGRHPADGRFRERPPRIDYLGAAVLAAALADAHHRPERQHPARRAGPCDTRWVLASGVAFVLFILMRTAARAHPLVRLDLFRRPLVHRGQPRQPGRGRRPHRGHGGDTPAGVLVAGPERPMGGGLLLMRLTVMIPVGAVLGGWMADRVGYRLTAVRRLRRSPRSATSSSPPGRRRPRSPRITRDLAADRAGLRPCRSRRSAPRS